MFKRPGPPKLSHYDLASSDAAMFYTSPSDAMEKDHANSSMFGFISDSTMLFHFVLLLLTVLVLYVLYEINKSPSSAPPSIWGLPLVGNLLQLGPTPHLGLTKIGKNLGDVFLLRLGSWDVVVINSLDAAKDALVKNSAHLSSRPPFHSLRLGGAHLYSVSFGDYSPLQVGNFSISYLENSMVFTALSR